MLKKLPKQKERIKKEEIKERLAMYCLDSCNNYCATADGCKTRDYELIRIHYPI
jgi:hypothetical protein